MFGPHLDHLEEYLATSSDVLCPFLILTVVVDHYYFLDNFGIALGFSLINEIVAKFLPIEVFMKLCSLICLLKARVDQIINSEGASRLLIYRVI